MRTPFVLSLATARLIAVGSADTSCAPRVTSYSAASEPGTTVLAAPRAVIALGGLQDCCLHFPDAPRDKLRAVSVDGALAALGI